MKKQNWVIVIAGGYGAFWFEGTEQEAEEMRVHKASWEGAIARKRLASDDENPKKISQCWNHPNFHNKMKYSCDCGDCASKGGG